VTGFLGRLFGKSTPAPAARAETHTATLYTGNDTLEVVGESHYQEALWRSVGGRTDEPVRHEVYAVLLPDPGNEYDPHAIEVRLDGARVGYLSREDAVVYGPGLARLMAANAGGVIALHAVIVGGGPRRDGIGFLGVFLDHDPTDFGLAPRHVSMGRLRTGLSHAMATDLEDDSYDLSWYGGLSGNDPTAVRQLRSLLANERDLIDRHYMLCELEHRLYRSRDAFTSALDEFDVVCHEHDDEMEAIRPALLDKFGAVPVIEMYRQAVIRCQKAKQWHAAQTWAERGIVVYGDRAARPEFVDDLHKRVAYAAAKIEAAERPKSRKPRGTTVAAPAVPVLEALVCESCGASFERERTRGRKPKTCSVCRGLRTSVVSS
jgi:hypothetical protein